LLGGSTLLDRGPVLVLLVTESNRLHGSNSNTSRYPRSNLFVVYNSVENPLAPPFAASEPPPTFIADRDPMVV
jgi:ectoine hydroxylase